MGDALIQYTFPNSQFLINLQDGILKKTGKVLQTAIAGEDYLKELPNLTTDMVWRGDATNRPVESPYVSEERLQELVEQAEAAAEEAEAAAEEATGAAEEATGAAGEATAAAGESSASAFESSISAGLSAASAAASAASAFSASSDASDAEDYKNEAHDYLTQTQTYYNNLITTGLNALPCSGDVSLNGFKIINMGAPVNDNDGVNKKYYDDGYAVLQSEIDNIEPGATSITLQGDITGTGPLNAPVSTIFNKTLNTINNAGNVSLSGYKLISLGSPVDATDGVTKQYCDQKVSSTISSTNITLQGDISGSGALSSSISTTFNKTLNNIGNAGDVSLVNYKLIGLGNPTDPSDGANKQYCDQKISSTIITLQGDITGTGALSSNISTTFTKTLNTINTTGNVDVKNFNIVNLKDPQGPQHAATQNWVQNYVSNTITNPVSGNFTPTLCDVNKNDIIGDPTYGGQGYDMQMGRYLKVGPMVFIEMHIICGGGSYGNDQTQMYFDGLPFNITYSNIFYLPINYVNCDANNILRLYITISPISSPPALTCIYQSQTNYL